MTFREMIYFLELVSSLVISLSFFFLPTFIDLNEDVWGRVSVRFLLLMGPVCAPHTRNPSLPQVPVIPARLSGRALGRLSDEMMTLLWKVIPKWEGIRQRLHPLLHCHAVLLLRTASCADDDWFASDRSQEAPIDFSVFYQKYLFTVVSNGCRAHSPHAPFSKWGII